MTFIHLQCEHHTTVTAELSQLILVTFLESHTSSIYIYILLRTCEASRFNSNSNRTIPIQFKSGGLIRIFKLATPAIVPQTITHCSTKNVNRCTIVI